MKRNLFLIELMLAILMFALASAVCLKLFVDSKQLAEEAHDMDTAVQVVSTIEETFMASKSVDSAMDTLASSCDNIDTNDNGGTIVFDADTDTPLIARFTLGDGNNGTTKIAIQVVTNDPGEQNERGIYEADVEVFYEN